MAADITIDPAFQGTAQHDEKTPLIDGVVVSPVTQNVDDRQNLMVYLKESDPFYKGFAQSYVSVTAEGVVKAWHYHLKQTDIWFVPHGKIKVGLFDARKDSPTYKEINDFTINLENPILVKIPRLVYHGFKCVGDKEAIVINTPTLPYNPDEPDEYRLNAFKNDIPYDWKNP